MLRENFTISNAIFARQVIFSSRVNRINKISGVSNPARSKRYIQEISWKMVLAGFVDTLYMYSEAVVVLWRTSACMSTACAVLIIVTPHPAEERSTVVRVYVCCGCLSVREHVSGTTCPISVNFYACYGRGSALLWRRCDTLCTSGFRDDVILARSGVNRRREKGVYSVTRQGAAWV